MLGIVLGVLFIALGIVFLATWFGDFLVVLKGSLPVCVALIGFIFMSIGISTVREKQEKKEEETKKTTEEK